jgi:hypothetical protein
MLSFFAHKTTKKLSSLIVISLIALTVGMASVEIAYAKPSKKELPKPYFPSLGDGDTINRKYLHPGTFSGGFEYTETGDIETVTSKNNTLNRIKEQSIIKWSILCHLIKY